MNILRYIPQVFFVCLTLCGSTAFAHEPWDKITQNQVPSQALSSLKQQTGREVFDTFEKRPVNGVQIYRGLWNENNLKHKVAVSETGDLVKAEEETTKDSLPPQVLQAIQQQFANAGELRIQKEFFTVYDIKDNDTKEHFHITADGRALTKDDKNKRSPIAVDQIPQTALNALKAFSGNAKIEDAFTKNENGVNIYGIHWTQNGVKRSAVVLENGFYVKVESDLNASQVPDYIKSLAASHYGNKTNLSYQQETVLTYEIRSVNAPKGNGRFRWAPSGAKVKVQDLSIGK